MRRLLLAGVMLFGMSNNLIASTHPIDIESIKNDVEELTSIGSRFTVTDLYNFEVTNPDAQLEKVEYIEKKLSSYGYKTKREYFYASEESRLKEVLGINVTAFKEGTGDKTLELGAHYDTAGVDGADDNISGTAGVLEAARVLSKMKTKTNIRFVFYDLEEIGLEGSKHHVKMLKKFDEKVHGAYVFEMIGFKSRRKLSKVSSYNSCYFRST